MLSLKNIAIASTAALAMTGAAVSVAQAQPYRYYGAGVEQPRFERRFDRTDRLTTAYVDSLDWRIDNAAREGRISWREARELRADLAQVKPLAWRYETGQARQWEVNRLARTVDRIREETRG